jgi:hypothetical protein
MRAWNKHPEGEIRERYLGEIAPLLEAARQAETQSPVDKKRVRKRILRTMFGTRRPGPRARLLPVLVAVGLLVVGGAAFATAQRLGIIPRLGGQEPSSPAGQTTPEQRKRRSGRVRPVTQPAAEAPVPAASEPVLDTAPVVLPKIPDPLLSLPSQAKVWVWAPANPPAPAAQVAPAVVPAARKPAGREIATRGSLAMHSSSPSAGFPGPPAPVISAPPLEAPAEHFARPAARPTLPSRSAPPSPIAMVVAPSPAPAPAPSTKQPPVAQPALPALPPAAPAEKPAPAAKPLASDQSMFGNALRKLRAENDPAGALSVLREHRQAYPKSALSGERTALEVESLLALHRDKDALAVLDPLALEGLPRSGERFVLRGELRAAAKRWLEAKADFEQALSRVSGSPAWHQRALWGRAVSRLRLGDKEGGLADIERYRDTYPKGRFAAEAAKFFPDE